VEKRLDPMALSGLAREEDQPAAVFARSRQGDTQSGALAPEEPIGHLDQDAGAVSGVGLAAARAAVKQVLQDRERLLDDAVGSPSLEVDHEADAARVVLVTGIVEALGRWHAWRRHRVTLAVLHGSLV
jgi:hypothetical protein